jgi:hypothetical protein
MTREVPEALEKNGLEEVHPNFVYCSNYPLFPFNR